jgi:hypothetical protein
MPRLALEKLPDFYPLRYPSLEPKLYECGYCGKLGHNRRGCPLRQEVERACSQAKEEEE